MSHEIATAAIPAAVAVTIEGPAHRAVAGTQSSYRERCRAEDEERRLREHQDGDQAGGDRPVGA